MTPETQRIAIAKACGLNVEMKTICPYCKGNTPYEAGDDYGITLYEECRTCNNTGKVEPYCPNIPYYIDDLNAMHGAEKVQFYKDVTWHRRYARELHRIVIRDWNTQGDGKIDDDPKEAGWLAWYLGSHATAAQRAETFLRTLNLWKE